MIFFTIESITFTALRSRRYSWCNYLCVGCTS